MAWPIQDYLAERQLELAPRTIAAYRAILSDAERRSACEISMLTSKHLLELASSWNWRDQSLSALRGFLTWCSHPLAAKVPRGIPPGSRRQLTWYTLAEVEAIVDACSTPRERLIVHLALELMLRRVEIERLTWEDLQDPAAIRVLGKGRHGGKVRRIPWHPYTREMLRSYISTRALSENGPGSTVTSAGASRRNAVSSPEDPQTSFGSVLLLKKSALDLELKRIEASLKWEGVSLSLEFHALRRTGGRLYVQAGISIGKGPMEVLNELRGIYGHEDLRTTIRYIGWELEEAAATMAAMPSLGERKAAGRENPVGEPDGSARPAGGLTTPVDRVGLEPTVTRTVRKRPSTPPTS